MASFASRISEAHISAVDGCDRHGVSEAREDLLCVVRLSRHNSTARLWNRPRGATQDREQIVPLDGAARDQSSNLVEARYVTQIKEKRVTPYRNPKGKWIQNTQVLK